MVISIDVEKAFHKIQHPVMIKKKKKTLKKADIVGTNLNTIKAIYENSQQKLSSMVKE